MHKKQHLFVSLVGIAILILASRAAQGQRYSAHFRVSHLPQVDTDPLYRLSAFLLGPIDSFPNDDDSLLTPDGTVLDGPSHDFDFNSFAELSDFVLGDWTAIHDASSGQDKSYVVRVNPFSLDDVFFETPTITTPNPGSNVPKDFLLKWVYPSGAMRTSLRLNTVDEQNVEIRRVGFAGPNSVAFQTARLQPGPGYLTLRAGASDSWPSPPIVSRSAALQGAAITTELSFAAMSLPATFHFVPEPSTTTVVGVLLAALAGTRIRVSLNGFV
jgi:hypothetical protein